MSWVAVGVTAAGAIYGGVQGQQEAIRKQKIEDRTRKANAAATAVSWARKDGQGNIPEVKWNDMGVQGGTFKGAMGGAMTGYSLGSGIDKGMSKTTTQPTGTMGSDGTNALGGQDMSNQLGAQSNEFAKAVGMQQTPVNQAGAGPMDWNSMAGNDYFKGSAPQPGQSMQKKPTLYGSF